MKSISIKQPLASLIVHGIKDIENRTWACPKRYIGQRVLIHAGMERDSQEKPLLTEEQFDLVGGVSGYEAHIFGTRGAIIGSVEIVDCVINHSSIWAEKTDNYTIGINPRIHEDITGKKIIYNWVLANPIIYEEPIENVKGKLSFWDYPGIQEVKIECPECGSIEIAVEDHTTEPFSTYLHCCNKCYCVIMESEWERVEMKECRNESNP